MHGVVDLKTIGSPRLVSVACADLRRLSAAAGVKMHKLRWALGLDPGGASVSTVRAVERGLRAVAGELANQERTRSERLTHESPVWMRADVLVHAGLAWRIRRRIVERLERIMVKPAEVSWPWGSRPIEAMAARGCVEDLISVALIESSGRRIDAMTERFALSPAAEATTAARIAERLWQGQGCWNAMRELKDRGVTEADIEALREGVERRMSSTMAHAIYGVLVRECAADEDARGAFVARVSGVLEWGEYRFVGALEYGGKLFEDRRRGPFVRCYQESETPERLAMIERANREIAALWAAAHSEATSD